MTIPTGDEHGGRAAGSSVASAWSPALAGAAEVVGLVRRLADRQQRDDLVGQLDRLQDDLTVAPVRVLVVGGPGQGKSSVVNALVGAGICPVGNHGVTAVPTVVRHHPDYEAALVVDAAATGRVQPERRAADVGEAVALAGHALNPGNQWGLRSVELGVPSPALARGLVLVDTPAVRDVWSPPTGRLLRAATAAAGVLFVSSAAAELTPGELDLLRTISALCHRLILVVNGTNAFADWQAVVARDRVLLEQRGVPATVVPVAAIPYWGAAGGVPPGPDPGMQQLASQLAEAVVLDAEHQRISRALVETFWSADRLRLRLFAEQAVLGDDAALEQGSDRLRSAAADAEALCRPDAPWRATLTSDMDRLRRDIETDLDAELSRLEQELDDVLAGGPWAQVHPKLHARLADAVVHVHRVRKLAVRGACREVAEQFQRTWSAIASSLDAAGDLPGLSGPRLDRPSLTGTRSFEDLPVAPEPPAPPDPDADPATAALTARALAQRWLAVVAAFLRADTDDLLDRVRSELEQRCQTRAIELHRSIVEVRTTLQLAGQLEPSVVLQRHEALASDLEALADLHAQLRADDAGRGHG